MDQGSLAQARKLPQTGLVLIEEESDLSLNCPSFEGEQEHRYPLRGQLSGQVGPNSSLFRYFFS